MGGLEVGGWEGVGFGGWGGSVIGILRERVCCELGFLGLGGGRGCEG